MLFRSHSFDEKVSLFTGENEWGETVVEEFVVPSSSQYLTVGPLYGEGTKFDIFGTVTRFLYLIGSSESYLLLVNSITLNLADITEE